MEIDWRYKHNQWFKNWLRDSGYEQYWNTNCCNYYDENSYFFDSAEYRTFKKCEQIIDNFLRCAKNKISIMEEAGLDLETEIKKLNQRRKQ